MDELDRALLEAWHNVSAELEEKPWKLVKRMDRVARKELRRPVRAWSLALRASDRRIGAHDFATPMDARCAVKGYAHKLKLSGERVRALCSPVRLDWPGLAVVDAAAKFGRDERTVWSWVKKGMLEVERQGAAGRRGKARHLVWSTRAVDPQADDGRGPGEVWGTLWQGMNEKLPGDFEQVVERVPRLRSKRSGAPAEARASHFCGWDWVCPGRRVRGDVTTGQHVPCGRVCKKLWLPLPAWRIGDALGDRAGTVWQRMRESGAAPASLHGGDGKTQRTQFACARCWGLRFDPVGSNPEEAWNRFVTVVSGGLLYGREVDCPPSELGNASRTRYEKTLAKVASV